MPAEYGGAGLAIAGFVTGYVSLVFIPLMLAMMLPAVAAAKHKAEEINSMNNMRMVGVAFKVWAGGHGGQYPFNLSQANGGTRELCHPDSLGFEQNPVPTFKAIANKLASPNFLVCPNDSIHHAAANFASLTADNLSYQLRTGPDINDSHPEAVLLVDPINGYVLLCDGSVQKDLTYKKKN